MANEVNAGGVTFPAHGLGRPFRAIRAFANSPAIYGRVIVRQNQLSPGGTSELPGEPADQGGRAGEWLERKSRWLTSCSNGV
jgi:hypothetical protein